MRVITGGCFDLLHYGHLRFLKKSKEFGDHLTVCVNTDEFVYMYKGKKPILTTSERVQAIKELDFVDEVIINETNENWMPNLFKVRPDFIVTSTDWLDKNYYKQMNVNKKDLTEMGIELKYIPYTKEISSTIIAERIYERVNQA